MFVSIQKSLFLVALVDEKHFLANEIDQIVIDFSVLP